MKDNATGHFGHVAIENTIFLETVLLHSLWLRVISRNETEHLLLVSNSEQCRVLCFRSPLHCDVFSSPHGVEDFCSIPFPTR